MAARPDVISLAQSEPVLLSSDSRKSPSHFKLVFPALNFPLDRDVKFRATSEFVNYRRLSLTTYLDNTFHWYYYDSPIEDVACYRPGVSPSEAGWVTAFQFSLLLQHLQPQNYSPQCYPAILFSASLASEHFSRFRWPVICPLGVFSVATAFSFH